MIKKTLETVIKDKDYPELCLGFSDDKKSIIKIDNLINRKKETNNDKLKSILKTRELKEFKPFLPKIIDNSNLSNILNNSIRKNPNKKKGGGPSENHQG